MSYTQTSERENTGEEPLCPLLRKAKEGTVDRGEGKGKKTGSETME